MVENGGVAKSIIYKSYIYIYIYRVYKIRELKRSKISESKAICTNIREYVIRNIQIHEFKRSFGNKNFKLRRLPNNNEQNIETKNQKLS